MRKDIHAKKVGNDFVICDESESTHYIEAVIDLDSDDSINDYSLTSNHTDNDDEAIFQAYIDSFDFDDDLKERRDNARV